MKVRSEIQWRERERDQLLEGDPFPFSIVFIPVMFLIPFCAWFGKVVGSFISIYASVILIALFQSSFKKSKEGEKLRKATRELKKIRKRKIELERKLDYLDYLKKKARMKKKKEQS